MYDTTWSHTAAKSYRNTFPLIFNIYLKVYLDLYNQENHDKLQINEVWQ